MSTPKGAVDAAHENARDVMKPNSQEFFTEFDLLSRPMTSRRRQRRGSFQTPPAWADQWDECNARFRPSQLGRNAAEPFDMTLARDGRNRSPGSGPGTGVNLSVMQTPATPPASGRGDQLRHKMFAEAFWKLLRSDGRLGVILPTGVYPDRDEGSAETLLTQGCITDLLCISRTKRVFSAAHHSFKQVALFVSKGGQPRAAYPLPHGRG
jgi:hypothetical protein